MGENYQTYIKIAEGAKYVLACFSTFPYKKADGSKLLLLLCRGFMRSAERRSGSGAGTKRRMRLGGPTKAHRFAYGGQEMCLFTDKTCSMVTNHIL